MHIIEQTPSRLVIISSPNYVIGLIFFLAALGAAGSIVFVLRNPGVATWPRYLPFIMAVPFLVASLAAVTARTKWTLERDSGLFSVRRSSLGIGVSKSEVRLDRVSYATVQAGTKGSTSLVVVVEPGERIIHSEADRRNTQTEVANAINTFLGRRPVP